MCLSDKFDKKDLGFSGEPLLSTSSRNDVCTKIYSYFTNYIFYQELTWWKPHQLRYPSSLIDNSGPTSVICSAKIETIKNAQFINRKTSYWRLKLKSISFDCTGWLSFHILYFLSRLFCWWFLYTVVKIDCITHCRSYHPFFCWTQNIALF